MVAIDPCVLGRWRLTPENARAFYRRILGRASAPIEVTEVLGTSTMTFNADGTLSLELRGLRLHYRVSAGDPVNVLITIAGTGSAKFDATSGVIHFTESSSAFEGSMRMTVGGEDRETPWNAQMGEAFGGSIRGDVTYTCADGSLNTTPVGVEGASEVHWVR